MMEGTMEEKNMEKPNEPFMYIAGRPYLPLEAIKPRYPESLTEEKGDVIVQSVGKVTEVKFDISPRWKEQPMVLENGRVVQENYEPFVTIVSTLEEYSKEKIGSMEEFDYFYRFKYRAKDNSLEKLLERKDHFINNEDAFEQYIAHHGMQRWSYLTMDIPLFGLGKSFRTDVDVFVPDSTSGGIFIIGLYSHKKEKLQRMQLEKDIRSIASFWKYSKDDERKLDEIIERIDTYYPNKQVDVNEVMASLSPDEYEFFLPSTFKILQLHKQFVSKKDERDKNDILESIDMLKKYHLMTEEQCDESPESGMVPVKVLSEARNFYLSSDGTEHKKFITDYFGKFALVEYSIQKKRAELRKNAEKAKM